MLVILSGSETIHKKWWAKKLLAALNTFEIDGYTVDYSTDQFSVYDADKNLVYRLHHDDNEGFPKMPDILALDNRIQVPQDYTPSITYDSGPGGHNYFDNPVPTYQNDPNPIPVPVNPLPPVPTVTLDKIHYTYRAVFLDGVRNNHFQNYFVDLEYDYAMTDDSTPPKWESKGKQFIHFTGYMDIINNYRNRPTQVHVITGSFSRRVIDKIKYNIGEDNVRVINIRGHPSVAYTLHEKGPDYYEVKFPVTPKTDDDKFIDSMLNQVNLLRFDDILQIKYEDVLSDGYFMFMDKKIELPANYIPYNAWITEWERTHFHRHIINNWRLAEVNAAIQDGHFKQGSGCQEFPANIFTALGYAGPLQRMQIDSPR